VIHERFVVDGVEYRDADETIVATGANLGDRKRLLAEHADVIVALPGGVGTLDELFEAAALAQLNFAGAKPVAVVNVDGYYAGVLSQLDRAKKDGLLSKAPEQILYVAETVEDVLAFCERHATTTTTTNGAATTNGGSTTNGRSYLPKRWLSSVGAFARAEMAAGPLRRRRRRGGVDVASFLAGLLVGGLVVFAGRARSAKLC